MQRLMIVSVGASLAALFVVACDGPEESPASRDYVVHNVVAAATVVSEVFRGEEKVAEVVLAGGQEHITMLGSDETLVSAPLDYDARAELERYSADVAHAVGVLEESQEQVVARDGSECYSVEYTLSQSGNFCVYSWCMDGCIAHDCAPNSHGQGEIHIINAKCGVT